MNTIGVKGSCHKGIRVRKSNVFKEFVMTLLASTRFFTKKINSIFIFVLFEVLFTDAGQILDKCMALRLIVTELFALVAIFLLNHKLFFEKYLNFWGFLSVPHLVEKSVNERRRKLICDRTLPSLLV